MAPRQPEHTHDLDHHPYLGQQSGRQYQHPYPENKGEDHRRVHDCFQQAAFHDFEGFSLY